MMAEQTADKLRADLGRLRAKLCRRLDVELDRLINETLAYGHVGETIRDAMRDARITTQAQFAGRVGVSQKHLSQMLAGRVPLSPAIALEIETVTGVSAYLLMCLQMRHTLAKLRPKAEHSSGPLTEEPTEDGEHLG